MIDGLRIEQIAAALRCTKRSAERRAAKEGWTYAQQAVRGGHKRLYALESLPSEVAIAVTRYARPLSTAFANSAAAGELPELRWYTQVECEQRWSEWNRQRQTAKDESMQRAQALQSLHRFICEGHSQGEARLMTVALWASRGVDIGLSTLRRWEGMVKRVRWEHRHFYAAFLLPATANCGRPLAEIPVELWDFIRSDYLRDSAPSIGAVYERAQRVARDRGLQLPSIDTVERRLRRLPRTVRVLAREGEAALERMYPAQIRDRATLGALEIVNADGHRWDVNCIFEDGTKARPVMVAFQDIYSGKVLAWRIDQTENAGAVRLAVGDLLEEYGIPEHCILDNGRGFASKWLTGGAKTRFRFKVRPEDPEGLFKALQMEIHWALPFHGQSKPIERAFRDLCETVAKHPACQGAYVGNSPVNKPESYGTRAIPIAEFRAHVAREIAAHNARSGRRGGVCAGRSFDQVFADSYATRTIRKVTAEQRYLFMLAAETVKAGYDGSVRLDGNRYWTEALAEHIGESLVLRFDPQNLHQKIHVYTLGGDYIGAADCADPAGFTDSNAGREHNRARREFIRRGKQQMAAERRMNAAQVAAQLPNTPAPTVLPVAKVIAPVFAKPNPNLAAERARMNAAIDQLCLDMENDMKAQGF